MHCNLVKNDYQHPSKVLFSFVPNNQFGQLINISPHSLTTMHTFITAIRHSSNSFQSWLVGMCIFQVLPAKTWSRGQTLVGDSVEEKHLHLIFLKTVDYRHPKSSEITADQTRPPKVKLYKWDFR